MDIGRFLIIIAIIIFICGLGITLLPKLFSWFGNLPGDIRIIKENSKIFIPIMSMIILSLIFTLLFNGILWLTKFFNKWK
jgi:H+/Cl- antiporter ClcA